MAHQFVESSRGKEKLVFNGLLYRHQRSRGRNHYFRCERNECNGTAILRDAATYNSVEGNVVAGLQHTHEPEEAREEILRMISGVRKDGAKTNAPPSAIVQIHRQEVPAKGAQNMPTEDA